MHKLSDVCITTAHRAHRTWCASLATWLLGNARQGLLVPYHINSARHQLLLTCAILVNQV